MWLVHRAMRRPFTVVVIALTILLSSALAMKLRTQATSEVFRRLAAMCPLR